MAHWNNLFCTSFSHFISLGYFCSVALELERVGLRSASSPFDWLVSDFSGVIDLIENHFDSFLDYDCLLQNRQHHQIYCNYKYGSVFFHDFDKYRPLREQLPGAVSKYERRIDRFYRDIAEPTLFLRYISDEEKNVSGKSAELEWIESHGGRILSVLKEYHRDNSILYIANDSVTSNVIDIFHVAPDAQDSVARMPFEKNTELGRLMREYPFNQRANNLVRYHQKKKKENSLSYKTRQFCLKGMKKIFLTEYVHDRQY